MIIAIDGPAGSGKSTVAKLVAETMGFHYLDTGAMYRAVAWRAWSAGISPSDEDAVVGIAQNDEIAFAHEPGESLPSRVFIAGEDATQAIRSPQIDDAVSAVARLANVRAAMVAQQRHLGAGADIVVEGRDIGTVVFPDAEVKIFLTASAEERARRRAQQQSESGLQVDAREVHDSITRRDEADSSRAVAPLAAAEDAIVLDTTGLTIAQVVDEIASLAREVRA